MRFSFFGVLLLAMALMQPMARAEKVRLLQDDRDALQARVDLIRHAESEIVAEYFSVWNDDESVGGLALLLQAAQRGVNVNIIMDALSNTVPSQLFAALLKKGKDQDGIQRLNIKVYNGYSILRFAEVMHRDHAKMLIVDGKRMITGGRNIGDKYFGLNKKRNFRDLDVLIEGPVAAEGQASFYKVWKSKLTGPPKNYEFTEERLASDFCAYKYDNQEQCESVQKRALKLYDGEITRIQTLLTKLLTHAADIHVDVDSQRDWFEGVDDDSGVLFLSHQEDQLVSPETAHMTGRLMEQLLAAEQEVNIISPYLILTDDMRNVFQTLVNKNVKIRVITNSLTSTDNLLAQAGYRDEKAKLIKMGLELYEYLGPDTAHAKVVVIDGKTSIVGTYNLDPRSAGINREVGVVITGGKEGGLAKTLTAAIEDFRANSLLVGKDGVDQNADVQKQREQTVTSDKRGLLKTLKFLLPFYRDQI